ncbi:MAG: CBASS oligonucleotide cyclase [Chloroflexi bacterium]|nr:CBASS oligonucleotide cyclase [Chloroflexota bacterium]
MSYVDDAFDKLKSTLEITKTESEQAQTRHRLIREHIEDNWKLVDNFLTGSYRRDTKTKKLKDVDIFVVVDPDGPQGSLAEGTGTAAVLALRDVLAKRWSDLDADDNVVTINYGDEDVASYEVAPVFPRSGGGYLMPNGAGWMDTDPQEQHRLVTAKNKACDEKFVPFVKMVKGMNREAGEPVEPAFLLEVMGLDLVVEPFDRYRDEIRFFLASVADQIEEDWPDPVGIGPDVNAGISLERRRQLSVVVRGWLGVAEEALQLEYEGKERAAVETWRELFGWRMPRP